MYKAGERNIESEHKDEVQVFHVFNTGSLYNGVESASRHSLRY